MIYLRHFRMLTGQYAANFVRGLQGETQGNTPVDPEGHIAIVACCKHFVVSVATSLMSAELRRNVVCSQANSLESWNGHTRHNFDAQVPLRDLADYYLPACSHQSSILRVRARRAPR